MRTVKAPAKHSFFLTGLLAMYYQFVKKRTAMPLQKYTNACIIIGRR